MRGGAVGGGAEGGVQAELGGVAVLRVSRVFAGEAEDRHRRTSSGIERKCGKMKLEMYPNYHHVRKPLPMEGHFTIEFQTGNGGYAYIKMPQHLVGSLIRKLSTAHSEWMKETYPEFVPSSSEGEKS